MPSRDQFNLCVNIQTTLQSLASTMCLATSPHYLCPRTELCFWQKMAMAKNRSTFFLMEELNQAYDLKFSSRKANNQNLRGVFFIPQHHSISQICMKRMKYGNLKPDWEQRIAPFHFHFSNILPEIPS